MACGKKPSEGVACRWDEDCGEGAGGTLTERQEDGDCERGVNYSEMAVM